MISQLIVKLGLDKTEFTRGIDSVEGSVKKVNQLLGMARLGVVIGMFRMADKMLRDMHARLKESPGFAREKDIESLGNAIGLMDEFKDGLSAAAAWVISIGLGLGKWVSPIALAKRAVNGLTAALSGESVFGALMADPTKSDKKEKPVDLERARAILKLREEIAEKERDRALDVADETTKRKALFAEMRKLIEREKELQGASDREANLEALLQTQSSILDKEKEIREWEEKTAEKNKRAEEEVVKKRKEVADMQARVVESEGKILEAQRNMEIAKADRGKVGMSDVLGYRGPLNRHAAEALFDLQRAAALEDRARYANFFGMHEAGAAMTDQALALRAKHGDILQAAEADPLRSTAESVKDAKESLRELLRKAKEDGIKIQPTMSK